MISDDELKLFRRAFKLTLKELMERKGFAITQLAAKSGVSQSLLTQLFNDKNRDSLVCNLHKILIPLKTTMSAFFLMEARMEKKLKEDERNAKRRKVNKVSQPKGNKTVRSCKGGRN